MMKMKTIWGRYRRFVSATGSGNSTPFIVGVRAMTHKQREALAAVKTTCLACGKPVRVLRHAPKQGWFLSFVCDLRTSIPCARNKYTHEVYRELRTDLTRLAQDGANA